MGLVGLLGGSGVFWLGFVSGLGLVLGKLGLIRRAGKAGNKNTCQKDM